jgi:hypothetical protein
MGKYFPLENYLKNLKVNEILLTFQEIEKIIMGKLPPSASKYSQWWENDKKHAQAKSWLNAGFKTVNLSESILNLKVRFNTIK